jgi:hypothetical protein
MVSSGIPSKRIAKEVLQYLRLRKVGYYSKGKIAFFPPDRLKTALMALYVGCDTERISPVLTWWDLKD